MAVVKTQDGNYIGLDSDTKPTDDVPPGVRFWEYDTNFSFVFDGTAWRHVSTALSPRNQLYAHLKNGASRDMVVDGSETPVAFKYTVPAGKYIEAERLNLIIEDGSIDPAQFGGLSEITNGVAFQAFNSGDAEMIDYCDGFPIKTNMEWGLLVGVDSVAYYGVGAALDGLLIRFSLYKGSEATRLDAGEYLQMTISDALAGIDKFHAMVQGKIFDA